MTVELDRALTALRVEFTDEINTGKITHIGISNCRTKNNEPDGPWSEHSWPNAADIHVTRGGAVATGASKILGNRIASWMRSHPELWSEVFWQIIYHRDHVHGTAQPRRNPDNKQVPPCAGGSPVPDIGDDVLGFNIGTPGVAPVRGEQAAALQLMLNDRGASLIVDGVAGDVTRKALTNFQKARQIGPPELGSGDIGAYTYAQLFRPTPAAEGVSLAQVRDQIIKAKITPG